MELRHCGPALKVPIPDLEGHGGDDGTVCERIDRQMKHREAMMRSPELDDVASEGRSAGVSGARQWIPRQRAWTRRRPRQPRAAGP